MAPTLSARTWHIIVAGAVFVASLIIFAMRMLVLPNHADEFAALRAEPIGDLSSLGLEQISEFSNEDVWAPDDLQLVKIYSYEPAQAKRVEAHVSAVVAKESWITRDPQRYSRGDTYVAFQFRPEIGRLDVSLTR